MEFIRQFAAESRIPITLITPEGPKVFSSKKNYVDGRVRCLEGWLGKVPRESGNRCSRKPGDNDLFGRSIMAEIVARDTIARILEEKTSDPRYKVFLAPSPLEASNGQRGGDLIIGKKEDKGIYPLFMVDVTLSSSRGFVEAMKGRSPLHKDYKLPGLNHDLLSPVAVLSLSRIISFTDQGRGFVKFSRYLEEVVKPALNEGNIYQPFLGMSGEGQRNFLSMIQLRLAQSLYSCREYLNRFLPMETLDGEVFSKLSIADRIFQMNTPPAPVPYARLVTIGRG